MMALLALTAVALSSAASSRVRKGYDGVFGIIDSAIVEPSPDRPERIQLWGTFAMPNMITIVDGKLDRIEPGAFHPPARGYLYYTMNPADVAGTHEEWAAFSVLAGTGEPVAFGGAFPPIDSSRPRPTIEDIEWLRRTIRYNGRLRPAGEAPVLPDTYPKRMYPPSRPRPGVRAPSHRLVTELLLAADRPAQPGALKAFTGLTLIDGTDRGPVRNATIVVRGGRILSAGPASSTPIPDGAERIVLDGKTVIPGLINAHGHVNDAARDLRVYAAHGVTTIFSLGGEQPPVFAARQNQGALTLDRSRVFVSGPVLTPRTPDEARTQVRQVADQRVDFVKIRVDDNLGTTQKMPPEVYRAVIDEAHRLGLRVAVHLFYLADAKAILAAGGDLVAHSVRDADVDAELIAALKTKGVCVSPTLMREVSTFVYESTPDFFADPLFLKYADTAWLSQLRQPARQEAMRTNASAQRYKVALEVASRNVKRLSDAGVPIAMGTDTGPMGRFQGYFELMELELMVKAGLTPRQSLLAATRDAARCMKVDRDLGTLEPGKWADFVALDASPLTDIANVKRIAGVWIAGNRVPR
jgi:imidazolonepropionase-like amidohydrolase